MSKKEMERMVFDYQGRFISWLIIDVAVCFALYNLATMNAIIIFFPALLCSVIQTNHCLDRASLINAEIKKLEEAEE